jgi:hypothetical protein
MRCGTWGLFGVFEGVGCWVGSPLSDMPVLKDHEEMSGDDDDDR